MNINAQQLPRLAPLGELDGFRVANGHPDLRGWELYGADSLRLGEVRDLVVDTDAMKARYMIVKLDRTLPNVNGDRQVLIPVRKARLDDSLDRVYLDDVTVANAYTLPDYRPDSLSAGSEQVLLGAGQPSVQANVPNAQANVPNANAFDSQYEEAGFIVIQRSTVSLAAGPDGSIILEEDVDEVVIPANAESAGVEAAPPGAPRKKEPV
ncbi:MAG: PRC-barrel domain-containing protein [Pseudomonadota bacterium]|nr:PRC-barrel domain-containing protein [Pseudomonadota bacterium]